MPAIPTYEQQIDARGSIGTRASPDDFGGQVAAGLGNLAAGAESAYMGTQIRDKADAAVLKEQDERQARTWSGSVASQAMVDWAQNLEDRKKAAAPGAPGFTPSLLTDFDAYTTKLVDSAPTSYARQFLTDHMSQLRAHVGQQAVTFQAGAVYTQNVDNADKTIDNSAKVVQQDPTQYALTMQMIKSTMPEVGGAKQAELTNAATKQLTTAAASSTLDRNPYALKDLTGKALGEGGFSGSTGVPWIDDASVEQVSTWNKLAEAKINQLENAKRAELDQRESIALKTYNGLVDFTNKGKVPDMPYLNQVLQDTHGTTQEDSAKQLLQIATTGAGFGSQTLPRQAATLTALEAQGNAGGSNPAREATMAQFRTIHQTQTKAYQENPWQGFTEFAHGPAQPEQPIGSPEQGLAVITARKPLMSAVENASGATADRTGISPLQPNEAAAWGATLATLPVTARAEVLGYAGAGLTAPQTDALADQLAAKDKPTSLMLKINDRTASGRAVAERIGIGAQGLADGTVKADETKLAGWKAEAATALRGALGNTKAEDDAILAAYYVRAASELPSGTTPGYESPEKSIEAAITMVVGQPINRGGVNTVLPHGMTEASFDAKLRSMTPDVLKTMAPDGKVYLRDAGGVREIPLNLLHGRMVDFGMKYYSPGVYAPVRNNSIITIDKDGTKPLLLKVQ